jgi:hypothetical protein
MHSVSGRPVCFVFERARTPEEIVKVYRSISRALKAMIIGQRGNPILCLHEVPELGALHHFSYLYLWLNLKHFQQVLGWLIVYNKIQSFEGQVSVCRVFKKTHSVPRSTCRILFMHSKRVIFRHVRSILHTQNVSSIIIFVRPVICYHQ